MKSDHSRSSPAFTSTGPEKNMGPEGVWPEKLRELYT